MTQEAGTEEVPFDKLVRIYRKMSAKIAELEGEAERQIAAIKEQRDQISNEMRERMRKANVTSMKTDDGTAILGTKTRYSTNDWDAFKTFMVENDALDLMEKRIAQGNMQQFIEANPKTPVPGLTANTEYTISVRKPTTK